MQSDEITKENIRLLIMTFYRTVLKDDLIGKVFISKLGDDINSEEWKIHLEILISFWASLALGDKEYKGSPFLPHTQLGTLKKEMFEQWLKLFFTTLDKIYVPKIADKFKERSTIIADNFMRNLGID